MEKDIVETDVLIIGAGIAGCRAAIEASDCGAKVTLVTKGLFGRDYAATWMTSCGYQCWGIFPHDTLDVQVEDTIRCGWFLNNQENVYAFLAHVPDGARELSKWGVRYRMKDGQFVPTWQLGCSTKEGRSITPLQWPRADLGYSFARVLPQVVISKKVHIMEDTFVMDLLTSGADVVGALALDIRTGSFRVLKARATILATGGYQGLYKVITSNPGLTGDGQAVALRAGADVMDFEFNQTLPCALWPPEIAGDAFVFMLITYYDAHMYNSENERFMAKWDPVNMEHSTRAIISRAIFHEIKEGRVSPHGGIYTSLIHHPESFIKAMIKECERSHSFRKLAQAGISLFKDSIETGYVMHYCQGGCNVNAKCETDKPGLYAIGEAASGSKDGADRMMSNALPYCMATGVIAGREAAQRAKTVKKPEIDNTQVGGIQRRALALFEQQNGVRIYAAKPQLQDLVHRETGYGGTEESLRFALDEVHRYKREVIPRLWVPNKSKKFNLEWINALELENLILIAECLIRNALARTESRGLHGRWDHHNPDPDWFKNIHLRLVDGELKQWTTPVKFTYWQPERGSLGEPWHKGVQVREFNGWKAEPLYKRMRGRDYG